MLILPLGTSSAVPTRERHLSAIAASFGPCWILLDCGEGAQYQILSSPLRPSRLDAIFITHLHGDHVFGLLGLISTLGMQNRTQNLSVYGPHGLRELVQTALHVAQVQHLPFELEIVEHRGGFLRDTGAYAVEALPLEHRIPAFGYRVTEFRHGGREPRHVLCSVAYCTDTRPCGGSIALARDADLLIHEATYAADLADKAFEHGHSTAAQAAKIARASGARRLLLTHFSSRYSDPSPLVTEASRIFPGAEAARDLVPVSPEPRPGRKAA